MTESSEITRGRSRVLQRFAHASPSNGPLQTVEELLLVRGVTPNLLLPLM